MRASYIVRREIHVDLGRYTVKGGRYGTDPKLVLQVDDAKALYYRLRDALYDAGEEL